MGVMDADLEDLPDDVAALKSALLTARARNREILADKEAVAAELAVAIARASEDLALIAHQKLRIAKLERQIYGPRSERSVRLIDQMEFQLEEAEAAATEDELAAERAVAKAITVAGFVRKRPTERNSFPEDLPRERVVIDRRRSATAVVERACANWAKTSPAHWSRSPARGR
jgi:transposase